MTALPFFPQPKPLPRVLTKQAKAKSKEQTAREFRRAVWIRDVGRSRASGRQLSHGGTDYDRIGEVHHVLQRSTNPDLRLDVTNGILLSKTEHALAGARCHGAPEHFLLEIVGPRDLGEPQTFTWRAADGKVLRKRIA